MEKNNICSTQLLQVFLNNLTAWLFLIFLTLLTTFNINVAAAE